MRLRSPQDSLAAVFERELAADHTFKAILPPWTLPVEWALEAGENGLCLDRAAGLQERAAELACWSADFAGTKRMVGRVDKRLSVNHCRRSEVDSDVSSSQLDLSNWATCRMHLENLLCDIESNDADFLDVLMGPSPIFQKWLAQGGSQTLISYGATEGENVLGLHGRIRSEYPGHLETLHRAPFIHVENEYVFVHAGIDPLQPVHQQDERPAC